MLKRIRRLRYEAALLYKGAIEYSYVVIWYTADVEHMLYGELQVRERLDLGAWKADDLLLCLFKGVVQARPFASSHSVVLFNHDDRQE